MNPEKAKEILEYAKNNTMNADTLSNISDMTDDDDIERPFEDYGCEEALADYLGLDPDEVHDAECDHYGLRVFETDDGKEYAVSDDEDEIRNAAIEEISSLYDDIGIEGFNVNIEDFVDADWFEEAMRESYSYYIDDIREESASDDNYNSRLEEEMDEYNCETEDEFLDKLCDQDPVDWYINDFGKEDFNEVCKKYNLVDVEALADYCIDYDGVANSLASYDGKEHEFDYKGHTFWAYRIN